MMKKKKLLALLLILITAISAVPVSASQTAEQGVRLNISRRRIAGEKAKYYFAIPSYWIDRVSVERVRLPAKSAHIEKLNVYYEFGAFSNKPLLMASLYVYNRHEWKGDSGFELVMKAKNYNFEAEIFNNNSRFAGLDADKRVYDRCFMDLGTPFRVKGLIEMPDGEGEIVENTVFANGIELETKVLVSGSVCLVPLRETAEMLGYTVKWLQKESAVELSFDKFTDKFKVRGDMVKDNRGFDMRLINGKTYVTSAYFFRILGKSIDIDRSNNVYISK